eukprot:TRINITY_DN15801_c0_g2_i1.p1 TRINITY_DN15801_c0_g2~~TRINITY_DN15801_c0_g2_i1.p1  ORF type:complete len:776 (-),score=146.21 TRINITY_DN15801_c0_g2_i1:23-2350(-)
MERRRGSGGETLHDESTEASSSSSGTRDAVSRAEPSPVAPWADREVLEEIDEKLEQLRVPQLCRETLLQSLQQEIETKHDDQGGILSKFFWLCCRAPLAFVYPAGGTDWELQAWMCYFIFMFSALLLVVLRILNQDYASCEIEEGILGRSVAKHAHALEDEDHSSGTSVSSSSCSTSWSGGHLTSTLAAAADAFTPRIAELERLFFRCPASSQEAEEMAATEAALPLEPMRIAIPFSFSVCVLFLVTGHCAWSGLRTLARWYQTRKSEAAMEDLLSENRVERRRGKEARPRHPAKPKSAPAPSDLIENSTQQGARTRGRASSSSSALPTPPSREPSDHAPPGKNHGNVPLACEAPASPPSASAAAVAASSSSSASSASAAVLPTSPAQSAPPVLPPPPTVPPPPPEPVQLPLVQPAWFETPPVLPPPAPPLAQAASVVTSLPPPPPNEAPPPPPTPTENAAHFAVATTSENSVLGITGEASSVEFQEGEPEEEPERPSHKQRARPSRAAARPPQATVNAENAPATSWNEIGFSISKEAKSMPARKNKLPVKKVGSEPSPRKNEGEMPKVVHSFGLPPARPAPLPPPLQQRPPEILPTVEYIKGTNTKVEVEVVDAGVQTDAFVPALKPVRVGNVVRVDRDHAVPWDAGYLTLRRGMRIVVDYVGSESRTDEAGYYFGTVLGPHRGNSGHVRGWFPSWAVTLLSAPGEQTAVDAEVDLDCTVCMALRRDILLLPCSHMPVCSRCWVTLCEQATGAGRRPSCPLCRTAVTASHAVKI